MPIETTFEWEGRTIRLSYTPRRWTVIDHVEIVASDREPLPITETGYKSHFFGPVEPEMAIEEVTEFVVNWLNEYAQSRKWQDFLEQSKQLSLF